MMLLCSWLCRPFCPVFVTFCLLCRSWIIDLKASNRCANRTIFLLTILPMENNLTRWGTMWEFTLTWRLTSPTGTIGHVLKHILHCITVNNGAFVRNVTNFLRFINLSFRIANRNEFPPLSPVVDIYEHEGEAQVAFVLEPVCPDHCLHQLPRHF